LRRKAGDNMPRTNGPIINIPGTAEVNQLSEEIKEVNFWQCVTFADTIKRYCEITMKKDNVSPLHAIAMFHLVSAGGDATPTHLAELMFRSKHSVTKIVDTLEKLGLIVRDFSSKDRRVTHIMVTPAGLEYVRNNQCQASRRARVVMDCLSDPEQKDLTGLTRKLSDRMTDILEKL
jgi:DNA-binding MarR family transcriptional regulator